MTTHTPGPWTQGVTLKTAQTQRWTPEQIQENDRIERRIVFANFSTSDAGTGRQRIAYCETEEDARLIAAAPDLLAALIALTTNPHVDLGDLVYKVRESEGEGWDGPAVSAWSEGVKAARAAIARATGSAADTPKIRSDSGIYCGDAACSGCISGDGNCMHSTGAAS